MATEKIFLSRNFSNLEFRCKCGHCDGGLMQSELVERLQKARDLYGSPVSITSGFRCAGHNARIGGVEKSRHLFGEAVDISCKDSEQRHKLVSALLAAGFRGIKVYSGWIHADIRKGALWFTI